MLFLQFSSLAKILLAFGELAVMRSLCLACSPVGGFGVWTALLVMMTFNLSQSGHNSSFSANWKIYWNGSPNIKAVLVKHSCLLQSQTQKIVQPDMDLAELNDIKLNAWGLA